MFVEDSYIFRDERNFDGWALGMSVNSCVWNTEEKDGKGRGEETLPHASRTLKQYLPTSHTHLRRLPFVLAQFSTKST